MTNSISEIRDTEMMFVIGSNTSEAHPIIAMEMKRAVQNALRSSSSPIRARSGWQEIARQVTWQLRPGTDVWLLNAMAHVIVTEGLTDDAFIARNTARGSRRFARSGAASIRRRKRRRITGVPAERDPARWRAMYATTK